MVNNSRFSGDEIDEFHDEDWYYEECETDVDEITADGLGDDPQGSGEPEDSDE